MKASSENRIRAGISAAFAFLLLLCMLAVLVSIAAAGIFSESHLRVSLENSNYIEKSYESFQTALKEQAREPGLPEELLSGSVERNTFEKALEASIGGEKSERTQELQSLENRIRGSIGAYLKANQADENERMEEAANEIAAGAAGWYENYTTFPFAEILSGYKETLLSWMKFVIPVSVLLGAFLIFLLLRMHEEYRAGGCYVMSSLLAAAFVSGIGGFVLRFGVHYDIPDTFPAYTAFAESFFKSPAIVLWVNGFCLAFLSVIGMAILSNKKKNIQSEVAD